MTGKTILLIEDNPSVMRNNMTLLESRGALVFSAANLAEARKILVRKKPEVIVLDIMLPDGSGLIFLKELRKGHIMQGADHEKKSVPLVNAHLASVPVLLLTAKGEAEDIVAGLSLGADDYLSKPYDLNVFAARIDALLRRSQAANDSLMVGSLHLNVISSQAYYQGEDLLLTHKEFALLLLLAKNQGKVLHAEYLYKEVWGRPLLENSSALKVQLSNLKKKLSPAEDILIETSRGEGYRLIISQASI
jgi:DNA-binding response OmpR family regulator